MIKAIGLFFLLLLKIIGWILLGVLLLLLISLLVLVFVPVRYTFEGCSQRTLETLAQKSKKSVLDGIQLKVKITWLMHVFCFTFLYGKDGAANELRIFGIDFLRLLTKIKNRKKGRRRSKKQAEDTGMPVSLSDSMAKKEKEEEKAEQDNSADDMQKMEGDKTEDDHPIIQEADTVKVQESEEKADAAKTLAEQKQTNVSNVQAKKEAESMSGKRRNKSRPQKKRKKERTARQTKKQASDSRTTTLRQKIQAVRKELADIQNRSAITHVWKEICDIIRNYKPKKFQADLAFSCADPALTGEVVGVLSWLPLIYRYPCQIFPDFSSTQFYVEGTVQAKGKVTVFFFVRSTLRLLRDKNFMRLIRKITGREKQAELKNKA